MRLMRGLALACLAPWLASLAAAGMPADGDWRFVATLDGRPIGEHRFTLSTRGEERRVESRAEFDVKLLGFTAYRYRHESSETWRGGCLVALTASTDDDGKLSQVRAVSKDDKLVVTSPTGQQELSGCVMSYAYWNAELRKQSHLLNPQTGRYEPVQIQADEAATANSLRLEGSNGPIDVRYSARGEWLGLDSIVAGGRKLTYRLK